MSITRASSEDLILPTTGDGTDGAWDESDEEGSTQIFTEAGEPDGFGAVRADPGTSPESTAAQNPPRNEPSTEVLKVEDYVGYCVHDLFTMRADASPDKVMVVDGDKMLTLRAAQVQTYPNHKPESSMVQKHIQP